MEINDILKRLKVIKSATDELDITIYPLNNARCKFGIEQRKLQNLLRALRDMCEHEYGDSYIRDNTWYEDCTQCHDTKES